MCKNRLYLGFVAWPQLNDRPRGKGREHDGREGKLRSWSAWATSNRRASVCGVQDTVSQRMLRDGYESRDGRVLEI